MHSKQSNLHLSREIWNSNLPYFSVHVNPLHRHTQILFGFYPGVSRLSRCP